jgi:hypothetical protein
MRRLQSWLHRHGPTWPLVSGIGTLLAGIGTLATLFWGVSDGRPTTPLPFFYWFAICLIALLVVAIEWSRWTFIAFASLVLVLLLVLVAEFGETIDRHLALRDARSGERVLVVELDRSERVAAAKQLKALAASSTGTTPLGSSAQLGSNENIAQSIYSLRWDLQRVLSGGLAAPSLIDKINLDQVLLTSALVAGRSTGPSSGVSVDGSALSLRWAGYFSTASDALDQLCKSVGHPQPSGPSWLCSSDPARNPASLSPEQLAQAVTPAVTAVDAAVQAVEPTTANADHLAANDKAFATAFTSPSLSPADAGALVAFSERASSNGSWWYASFDTGAWVILGLLLLVVLRGLLLLNNRNGWGPIEIVMDSSDSTSKPASGDLERIAKIRSYVVENVPEPAAALGSSALTQITSLATSTNLGAPTWLRALANFAEWALLPPSGYRVVVDFRTSSGGDEVPPALAGPEGASLCVVVRIATRGRSKTLHVATISQGQSEDDVLRSAGYWAAGWILTNCKLVPEWAAWPAPAGPHLGRFRSTVDSKAQILDNPLSTERLAAIDACIDDLESARASGPTSGAILTQLAEQYEFKNDFANALEINLQVARMYPRYYVARYRSSVGLSMLVSSSLDRWNAVITSPDQQGLRILDLIGEIDAGGRIPRGIVDRIRRGISEGNLNDENITAEVSLLAAVQLARGVRMGNVVAMCAMALRKDERRFWLARLRHPRLMRHNLSSAMPSISRVAHFEGLPDSCPPKFFSKPDVETVQRWSRSRNESAQVLYNLACYFAVGEAKSPSTAVTLLEGTQSHPYSEQIQASWMGRDPDLDSLHNVGAQPSVKYRFDRLVSLLWGGSQATNARHPTMSVESE